MALKCLSSSFIMRASVASSVFIMRAGLQLDFPLFNQMAPKNDFIADITPVKEKWLIVVKVVRVWFLYDENQPTNPYSMEIVFIDQKGDKIHVVARKSLIYKFEKEIPEGCYCSVLNFGVAANSGNYRTSHHEYKLNLQYYTKAYLLKNDAIPSGFPAHCFSFVPLAEICGGQYDQDYLVDVIGILTSYGTEREHERKGIKSKYNVITVEADGYSIQCTLFGKFADELNKFINAGDLHNAVVVVQFGKVKTFKGNIVLQNAFSSSNVFYNPNCVEAADLKTRYNICTQWMGSTSQGLSQLTDSKATVSDEFLEVTQRKTIEAFKDSIELDHYVVLGTIKHNMDDEWWYTACNCGKSVNKERKLLYCEKCRKHVWNVLPRYRIKVRVIDDTDSATFTLFDCDSMTLFYNKKCTDMIEEFDKCIENLPFPKAISDLVDKTMLFLVEFKNEVNSRFEQSFRVRKICIDPDIIKKFIETNPKPLDEGYESGFLVDRVDGFTKGNNADVVQDLLPKFSDGALDNESQCDEKEDVDLSKDSEELTPLKREYPKEDCNSVSQPPEKLKKKENQLLKNIKLEKE